MSYTINLSSGVQLTEVSDGHVDTSNTSLVLVGKNYAGYGQFLNENFVHLLENFASRSNPANPLKGQLWWDTNNNILKVYSGTSWKVSTGATSSPANSPPTDLSALGGDLWLDTTNGQLKVYNGSNWIVVGPPQSSSAGDTGVFPVVINDAASLARLVIQIRFSGINYACFSKETFTTNIPGFTTIKAGLNFNTLFSSQGISTQDVNPNPNTLVVRDSTSGISVGAVSATTITASALNSTSIVGNITIPSGGSFVSSGYSTYNGLELATVGGTASFTSINNTPVGNATPSTGKFTTVTLLTSISPVSNVTANLGLNNNYFNYGYANNIVALNSITPAANIGANIGSSTNLFNYAYTNTLVTNNIVTQNGIIPAANLGANIGSVTNSFNIVFGKAMQAQYADLAERFEADAVYEPGTVVEMGGPVEITAVGNELSENVFGVISTNAAYLMNAGAGSDQTHPPVAVQGRVPVKVTGRISKGDRLVSAGNGIARSGKRSEINTWNVIGRALENKTTDGVGIIEAVVKLNS